MTLELAHLLALLATAALFGSMAFFSFVVAPLVFLRLEPAVAGRFIRALFPWYYAVVIALALIAAGALVGRPLDAAIMGAIAAGGVISRQALMPRINHHRDRMLRGEDASGARFRRLHRASVAINGLQLAGTLVVLARLGLQGA